MRGRAFLAGCARRQQFARAVRPGARRTGEDLTVVIATLIALLLAWAPPTSYNQGNKLYAARDYAGAATAYREALKAGPSAPALFNLGNALFKSGKVGEAIVQYRRAHYLAPRDADITANLEFARRYRVDRLPPASGPLAQVVDDAMHRLSIREAALLAALLFALAGAALSMWIVRRWPALLATAAVFAAVALYGFAARQTWASEVGGHPAVVVVSEVNALSGPSTEFKQILVMHDGTEVEIREARGDYLLVQLPGGGGWVPKNAVERVY